MKRISKWRLSIVLILSSINILIGFISLYLPVESISLIIIIYICMNGSIGYIDKYLISPKLKNIEEQELKKENEKGKQLKEI